MASTIFPQLGREVVLQALGKSWRVARMDVDVIDMFVDWLKPQLPSPFAGLKECLPFLAPSDALALVKEAQAKNEAMHDYDSPYVRKALATKRGQLQLFLCMLRVHQPETTLTQAIEILAVVGNDKLAEIFETTRGKVQAGEGQASPQPAAQNQTGGKSPGA